MLILPACKCQPGGKVKSAVKNSFTEVSAHLDAGGHFYLYASTERIIKAVENFAGKLRDIIETAAKDDADGQEGLKAFDFVYNMLMHSGITEISGLGISSVAVEKDLNHSKMVLHHYKDKGKGLIWNLTEKAPHELTSLKLLPADTVMASFSDFKPDVIWKWLKDEAAASNIPEVKTGLMSVEPMLQKMGIDLPKLLGSLSGKMGLIISLDSKIKVKFPPGK